MLRQRALRNQIEPPGHARYPRTSSVLFKVAGPLRRWPCFESLGWPAFLSGQKATSHRNMIGVKRNNASAAVLPKSNQSFSGGKTTLICSVSDCRYRLDFN
jgi:hypothetical protein